MWQVLVAAAAAAGSGILAKKLINPSDRKKLISDLDQIPQGCTENQSLKAPDSILPSDEENSCSQGKREEEDGNIFKFSSPQTGPKDLKKKPWSGLKKNGAKRGKKVGLVDDQKRVTVCLKKRRTGKATSGKCASKDNSFGWGVGLGIMYMMSAGKVEIGRLNLAMEETGKVVQELKAEVLRRKSLCNAHASVAENETDVHGGSHDGPLFAEMSNKSMTPFGSSLTEGECGSSGVTEDQQPDTLEMDRLEAELQFELQKLPWCAAEGLDSDGQARAFEAEASARECRAEDIWDSNAPQYNGVLPSELDKKLCHVLIEQQGGQIAELEAKLHRAHSKLHEKEAELEALKNCVKRLGEFSLASASDEECEKMEDDGEAKAMVGLGGKPVKLMVGMKRAMGCHLPDCSSE